jgi:hypothetical protein
VTSNQRVNVQLLIERGMRGTGFFVHMGITSVVKRVELVVGCPTYGIQLKSISDLSG